MNISHLQKHLPWALPYSAQFDASQSLERHRFLSHDVMHVIKSMGDIAAVCERYDHGTDPTQAGGLHQPGIYREVTARRLLADRVADLVICALHIAKTNPFGEFDLEDVVIRKLEERNGVKIPQDMASTHPALTIIAP